MTTRTQRIDQIEAAILSMSRGMTALTQAIATMQQSNPTIEQSNPTTAKLPAPKPPKPQTTPADKLKFPKAAAGAITGTVYQHAVRRFGFAVVVNSAEQGKVWVNTVQANGGLPLFADLKLGQQVAYVVKESGHIVIDEPAATAATAASKTPKAAAPQTVTPKAATTMKLVAFGPVGDPCPHCGGKHSNEGKAYREMQCLGRIYLAETGKTAGGMWDMPFISWAHGKRGQTEQALPAPTPTPVAVTAPEVETVTTTPTPEKQYSPRIENGEHTVVLVGFPRTGTGRVKVHDLTTFNGHDDKGRWIDLYPALYSKVARFTANDRLVVTFKEGVVTRVKRVAQIERDTGVTAGIEESGLTQPPIKITGKPDDTKREQRKARMKAARKAA